MSGTLKIAGTTLATNPTNSKVEIDDAVTAKGIAKAWVRFDGNLYSASPIPISSQYNVSSVTSSAVGRYNVHFNNNLADSDYSVLVTAGEAFNPSTPSYSVVNAVNASYVTIALWSLGTSGSTYSYADSDLISVAIFGS